MSPAERNGKCPVDGADDVTDGATDSTTDGAVIEGLTDGDADGATDHVGRAGPAGIGYAGQLMHRARYVWPETDMPIAHGATDVGRAPRVASDDDTGAAPLTVSDHGAIYLDVTAAVNDGGELHAWRYRSHIGPQEEYGSRNRESDDADAMDRNAPANPRDAEAEAVVDAHFPYRLDLADAVDASNTEAIDIRTVAAQSLPLPAAAYTFARESFIDELAYERREDPLGFRLARLAREGASAASTLIHALSERAVWRTRPSPRDARRDRSEIVYGRGFAFDREVNEPGTSDFSAWIVDLAVDAGTGGIVVQRVIAGRTSGTLPDALAGDARAALMQPYSVERVAGALSLAMGTAVALSPTHDDTALPGAARSSAASAGSLRAFSFRTELQRSAEAGVVDPSLDGQYASQDAAWWMASAAPAAAAVANALFDATGVRFRAPPFTAERIRSALGPPDTRNRHRHQRRNEHEDAGGSPRSAADVARTRGGESRADDEAPDFASRRIVGRQIAGKQIAKEHITSARAARSRWRLPGLIGAAGVASIALSALATFSIDGLLNRPLAPVARPSAGTWSAETIERGRLIAAAGDCAVCHTVTGGSVNAGGRAIDTPFGAVYSTNLTPDEQTGIGHWSFDAFSRALRQGISRDGHHLYPAFPYTAFTKLSEADMTALYAFLMAQPAVHAPVPTTRLAFPFSQRGLMAGWNALFLKQQTFEPDPMRSAQWNRGAYLVDGLGHCSACHSPRNVLGAERGGIHYLSGGTVDGWTAPSLIADSKSPVKWNEAALFEYLKRGYSNQHGVAAGPMAPVVAGLSTLPDSDVQAIAHYIASLTPAPATASPPTALTPGGRSPASARVEASARARVVSSTMASVSTTGSAERPVDADSAFASGKRIFEGACAVCHAEHGGVGNFGVRPLMALNTSVSEAVPDNLLLVIQNGIDTPATDALGYMPGFRDHLDDRQIADLAAYIRARFAPLQAPWKGLERASARIRQRGPAASHDVAHGAR